MSLAKRCLAELIGTFWLVLGGCGSAVFAAVFPYAASFADNKSNFLGIGLLGVSLAFGLTVMSMAYAIGHISGCHLNPAVSFGLWAGKRFPGKDLLPYIGAQLVGAILAAAFIFFLAHGRDEFSLAGGNPLASNGFGPKHSPGGYSMIHALITEFVMTFMFLMVIMGVTERRAPKGFAPIAIGMALTLIHLISIPVTNTSVNPARSTGVALFAGPEIISQLWLFWVAPIAGALVGGWLYGTVFDEKVIAEDVREAAAQAR